MSEIQAYQPRQRNTMMIKNLCPGLVELGKIKIGNKGAIRKSQSGSDWQAPQKLDHFLITTNERGADNNFILDDSLHKVFGESPKQIAVRLIYDDISLNFATRYICYYGKTVFCSGDGEEAQRLQKDGSTKPITCPCERQDPKYTGEDGKGKGKCKINGILSVIIDGAQAVGGVWKFRTTSYNSVVGILSSLALIQRITGGRLAGIPLMMTVSPKSVANPLDGKQQTIYVVGLQYAGTIDTLRDAGYQIAITEAKHGISMKRIEEDAMLMLAHKPVGGSGLGDDLDQDVIEEFYPEEAKPGVALLVGLKQEAEHVKNEMAKAQLDNIKTAPPLASITVEAEVISVGADQVNTSTGEVVEPKQTRTRRTKEQMAADAAAQQAPVHVSPPDEDGWPDPPTPPGTKLAEPEAAPHPAEPEPTPEAMPEPQPTPEDDDSDDGDLF